MLNSIFSNYFDRKISRNKKQEATKTKKQTKNNRFPIK